MGRNSFKSNFPSYFNILNAQIYKYSSYFQHLANHLMPKRDKTINKYMLFRRNFIFLPTNIFRSSVLYIFR